MRYRMTSTNLVEWIALRLGEVPMPLIDTIIPMIQGQALVTSERVGLLDALAEGSPQPASALASRLKLDADCLVLVLRVLQGMGYAKRVDDGWALTALGCRHFGPRATEHYGANVRFSSVQWSIIARLDEVLATGCGVDFHKQATPNDWASYQHAMVENASAFAWFVVKHVSLPLGATTCLDIAGAHGLVGAALCRAHPGLRSTVFDLPQAIRVARDIAKQHGVDDVVSFREGDLLRDELGRDVDVALLCNILHHFDATQNVEILTRVHRALRPGATVAVFDAETPEDSARREAAADAFALLFRVSSSSSCFRSEDYESWLRKAGFSAIRVLRTVRLPTRLLLLAQRH